MDESHLRDVWIVFIPKPKEQKVIIFCVNNLKHLQDFYLSHMQLYIELQVHF